MLTTRQALVCIVAGLAFTGTIAPVVGAASPQTATEPNVATAGPPQTATPQRTATPRTHQADNTTISSTLQRSLAAAQPSDKLPVIVVFETRPKSAVDLQQLSEQQAQTQLKAIARNEQQRAREYLQQQQQRNRASAPRTLWSTNSLSVTANPGTITELAALPNVEQIVYDRKVSPFDSDFDSLTTTVSEYGNTTAPTGFTSVTSGDRAWGVEYIGADAVQERGVTGAGINVSVVDTGIDDDHPALSGAVTKWKDFTPDNYSTPGDPNGHGTHVAGTIAGRTDAGRAVGVAPGVNLFGAKLFSETPSEHPTRMSDIISAFEWSANNDADVVSASLGASPILEEHTGETATGADQRAQSTVTVHSNASAIEDNFSTAGFKPAYVFTVIEPVAVDGEPIDSDATRAAVMENLSVRLKAPDGDTPLTNVSAGWAFETGEVPDEIAVRKYKPAASTPITESGNWTLEVTTDSDRNISYSYTAAPVYPSNGSDELAESIDTITESHDITSVIAAGNDGFLLGNRSIASPGVASQAITVGATMRKAGTVAPFSSRGPVDYGADERPGIDITAPGEAVVSAIPVDDVPESEAPYGTASGTSMATPHVSGTVALMLAADPGQSPATIRSRLQATAQDTPHAPNVEGAGVVDTYAAVNASNASALTAPTTEAGRHTLFGGLGSTGDDQLSIRLEPHHDPAGDAGDAPDIALTSKAVPSEFDIGFHDTTTANATIRLYIDADQNDTTGDSTAGGAEYLVVLNRTFDGTAYDLAATPHAYNASQNGYTVTDEIGVYPGDASGSHLEVHGLSFATRPDHEPFDWFVTSANAGSAPSDRFPDTAEATYGVSTVNVSASAVAWNATAKAADAGASVSFEVYDPSGTIVANRTATTNTNGRADVALPVNTTYFYEEYTLEINDQYTNTIRQSVEFYPACIACRGDHDGLAYTVEERAYTATRNESVTLNIPVYADDNDSLTPYTGPASLKLTNYATDEELVINDLSVDDGVVSTTVDLSSTSIADTSGYIDIELALAETFAEAPAQTSGGHIDLVATDVATSIAPLSTVVNAGETAQLSFQHVQLPEQTPTNVSATYTASWITDRQVAALYAELPEETVDRLKERRQTAGGDTLSPLGGVHRAEITAALQNLSAEGFTIRQSSGTVPPTKRGVGTFDVQAPADARFGVVAVKTNESNAEASMATVFVDGAVQQFGDRQTEPRETSPYQLELDGDWPTEQADGYYVPGDNATVDVALIDRQNETLVGDATVTLYTTFGKTKTVTTSADGPVTVTVAAPDRDWRNTSYRLRHHQILGVVSGYTTGDGEPIDERESVYGVVSESGTGTQTLLETAYDGDGVLENRIDYVNETYEPVPGERTLLTATVQDRYRTTRDVAVRYVDPGTQSTIAVNVTDSQPPTRDEARTYEVTTQLGSEDTTEYESVSVAGLDVTLDRPDVVTAGEQTTVSVRVTDRHGDAVTDAVVRWEYLVDERDRSRSGEASLPYQTDGQAKVGITNASGVATFQVSVELAEEVSAQTLPYRIGVVTANTSQPTVATGTLRAEAVTVPITGTFETPDGTPSVNDTIAVFGDKQGDVVRTSDTGNFTAEVAGGGSYDVQYYQRTSAGVYLPRDGVVDVYAADHVKTGTDAVSLGTMSLPEGNVLDVQVVDDDGQPVPNASITVTHHANNATATWASKTDSEGRLNMSSVSATGIEVAGNVSVTVEPPAASDRFNETAVTKTLTVTNDTQETVTLTETVVEGRVVYPDGTTVHNDTVVAWEYQDYDRTDSDGQFTIPAGDGNSSVAFYQTHADGGPGDFDGVPDFYALANVSGSTSLGETTLPTAHRLNVTVVDNDSQPVANASVAVVHRHNDGYARVQNTTTETGELVTVNRSGVEVAGNVTVIAEPPTDDVRFRDTPVTRTVEMDGDRSLTLTLEERTEPVTNVTLSPRMANTTLNNTQAYDVVVTNATGGVGAFNASLSVANGSVGAIQNVSIHGNAGLETIEIADDGSNATFDGALMDTADDGRVVVATVTIRGAAQGRTGLNLSVNALGTESGTNYEIRAVQDGRVTVEGVPQLRESYSGPPTDPDGDGVFEDINGDGEFNIVDVQAMYNVRNEAPVQDNTALFDVNNDGIVDIVDVQALYVEQGGDS